MKAQRVCCNKNCHMITCRILNDLKEDFKADTRLVKTQSN